MEPFIQGHRPAPTAPAPQTLKYTPDIDIVRDAATGCFYAWSWSRHSETIESFADPEKAASALADGAVTWA